MIATTQTVVPTAKVRRRVGVRRSSFMTSTSVAGTRLVGTLFQLRLRLGRKTTTTPEKERPVPPRFASGVVRMTGRRCCGQGGGMDAAASRGRDPHLLRGDACCGQSDAEERQEVIFSR